MSLGMLYMQRCVPKVCPTVLTRLQGIAHLVLKIDMYPSVIAPAAGQHCQEGFQEAQGHLSSCPLWSHHLCGLSHAKVDHNTSFLGFQRKDSKPAAIMRPFQGAEIWP